MPPRKSATKDDLVNSIISRQKDVIDHKILEPNLIDLLVPLSGDVGRIKDIDDDGNVTIEFTAPVASSLRFLTKEKLKAILALLDEIAPENT